MCAQATRIFIVLLLIFSSGQVTSNDLNESDSESAENHHQKIKEKKRLSRQETEACIAKVTANKNIAPEKVPERIRKCKQRLKAKR